MWLRIVVAVAFIERGRFCVVEFVLAMTGEAAGNDGSVVWLNAVAGFWSSTIGMPEVVEGIGLGRLRFLGGARKPSTVRTGVGLYD